MDVEASTEPGSGRGDMIGSSLFPIATLWIEGHLGPIERLCLASFVAHGHQVTLFAYGDITGLPPGVIQVDARTILPEAEARANRYENGSYALFSNLFRYELLRRGLGLWVDTDVVCVQPIRASEEFVAGWESPDFINGAVLFAEVGSAFIADALTAFRSGRIPAWAPWHKVLHCYARQLLGQPIPATALPHGTFGPKGVTALAKRHGLTSLAQPREVFYPVPPRSARKVFDPDYRLADVVRPTTLAIHLWNEKLRDIKHTAPPVGSLLRSLYERYGM
jgi:hypothetical protein